MAKLQQKLHEMKRARQVLQTKRIDLNKQRIELLEKEGDMSDDDSSRLANIERDIDEHGQQISDHDDRIGKCERALDMDMDGGDAPDQGTGAACADGEAKARYDHRDPWGTGYGYGEPPKKEGKGYKAARFAIGVLLAKTAAFERRHADRASFW